MADLAPVRSAPEDVLSTLHSDGRRRWIYPVTSRGKFWKNRRVVAWSLMALFVALPLIPIGGKPAILLDVVAHEFVFFGLTLYATDTVLLMLFALIVLVAVFLFTAVFGRVWCGWACPQTVYLEFVYRPIEALIEGKPTARKRRDEAPTSFDKIWRKVLKWAIFAVISLALAHTFVAYFASWDRLVEWMRLSPLEHPGFFATMAITTGLILFDFGIFREQMCTLACPYARFQSVLQDRDSMIVSYDPVRGEPRGRRTKKTAELGLGDCVDCGACVRTCPTGIDIRNGLQMECIGCTQCIDACDAIMISVDKPVGLIRYTSENQLAGKKPRPARPRTIAYATLLAVLSAAFVYTLAQRDAVDVNVGRAVGAPFMTLPGGDVSNRLRFRIQNRTGDPATYRIETVEPEGLRLTIVGRPDIDVAPGATARVEAWVVAAPDVFTAGSAPATFRVSDDEGRGASVDFTLLGPN